MIEKAKLDYMNGMKYKDLAEKYNVSINTVKSWVSRNGWAKEKRGAHKKEKGAHKKKTVITATKNEDKVQEKIIEEVAANSNLTDKQQLFCIYYLKYFNATKAYQKSYGCSYNTAMVEGHRSLRKPNIKLEIERLKAERLKGIYLDSKEILQQYIDIAFTDITDYVEFGVKEQQVIGGFGPLFDSNDKPIMQEVNYVEFKDSTEVDGSLINEISLGKNGASIKLHDKMKALDWLAKNLPKINEVDLDKELLAAKVEKEKAQTKLLQMQLSELNGEDIDQDAIDNFIEATKPKETDIEDLFEDES